MNYKCAAALGAVSGMRSMAGPALVAGAAKKNLIDLRGTPLSWLGSGRSVQTWAMLAGGELVADKLPMMGDRTAPPALIFRAISGGICGYAVCGSESSERDRWIAAAIGGAVAVATAFVGIQFRKRSHLPGMVSGLIEDAVAGSIGATALASLTPAPVEASLTPAALQPVQA